MPPLTEARAELQLQSEEELRDALSEDSLKVFDKNIDPIVAIARKIGEVAVLSAESKGVGKAVALALSAGRHFDSLKKEIGGGSITEHFRSLSDGDPDREILLILIERGISDTIRDVIPTLFEELEAEGFREALFDSLRGLLAGEVSETPSGRLVDYACLG